jgi:hypothetical protein
VFTAVVDRPGDSSLELTPLTDSCGWDSAAVGGFGSCTFTVAGLVGARDLPYLATVRLYFGTLQLWEGRIEDATRNAVAKTTTVQAFGWKRALDFNSVRRIWSKRDIGWYATRQGIGSNIFGTSINRSSHIMVAIGAFDASDLTKSGVRVNSDGATIAASTGGAAEFWLPAGLTISRLMGTYVLAGAGTGAGALLGVVAFYNAGTYVRNDFSTTSGDVAFDYTPGVSTSGVRVGIETEQVGGSATDSTTRVDFYDMRLLGTATVESAAGGFYGSAILRDLIALVPELTAGTIETGSDFTIQAIGRSVRDAASSIVDEVASYYAREWAVWEGGRFDWTTPNLDEPQYVVAVADCSDLEITGSLDTLVRTGYVLYTDAASGIDAEASAASTSRRNPFVRTGTVKDDFTNVSFPMTANTAGQLAARVAAERGDYPPITGRIELPAQRRVKDETGQTVPAFAIRAGRNVYIPDLPRDEIFSSGRDGQTLFHIVTANADMKQGTVTLELEGQGRQMDVILARLAAVTRTLTG